MSVLVSNNRDMKNGKNNKKIFNDFFVTKKFDSTIGLVNKIDKNTEKINEVFCPRLFFLC